MLDNNDRVTGNVGRFDDHVTDCYAHIYTERFMLWAPVPIEI